MSTVNMVMEMDLDSENEAMLEDGLLFYEKTQKELDDEIKKKKEKQRFFDDVGVLVAMVSITLIAIVVVIFKVILVHKEGVELNITTFKPIEQMKGSKIKYTGNGFIPCNGVQKYCNQLPWSQCCNEDQKWTEDEDEESSGSEKTPNTKTKILRNLRR